MLASLPRDGHRRTSPKDFAKGLRPRTCTEVSKAHRPNHTTTLRTSLRWRTSTQTYTPKTSSSTRPPKVSKSLQASKTAPSSFTAPAQQLHGSLKLHSPSPTAPRLPRASQPQPHGSTAPSSFTAPATQLHGSFKLHSPSSTAPRLPQVSQPQSQLTSAQCSGLHCAAVLCSDLHCAVPATTAAVRFSVAPVLAKNTKLEHCWASIVWSIIIRAHLGK